MGANERGVVIGNEAVFAKIPHRKENGLIGMDFLRLGLERGATAFQALEVITNLLEKYGQAGNCGFQDKFYYYNSFLIADANDAWVLETAERHWVAKQVRGIYSISNGYTIGKEWDLASANVVSYAIEKGWCKSADDFHFGRCYADFLYSKFSYGAGRCLRTDTLLNRQKGHISVQDVMRVLRDHGEGVTDSWSPDGGISGATVCMHAGYGPVRVSQTTGSMVSYLHPEHPLHFLTGTAAPCTSIFKPVWLGSSVPHSASIPNGEYDDASLWWRHETLHRLTLRDYGAFSASYLPERDELEEKFIRGAFERSGASPAEKLEYSLNCFDEAKLAEESWIERVRSTRVRRPTKWYHALAWGSFNRDAKIKLE